MKEEQTKRQRLAAKKYQAYRELFTSEQGQEVLTDLMRAAHFLNTTVGSTPYETYFNEGRRSLLLQIVETAKLDTEQMQKLTQKLEDENLYLI